MNLFDTLTLLGQFNLNTPAIRWPLTIAYVLVLVLIAIYGMHRYLLVWLYYRHRGKTPQIQNRFEHLPKITIQLPMFNESNVAQRIIDAACQLDYPADRLQIQVVDDSTDDSTTLALTAVKQWQDRGIDIQYLHREHRQGFKAGALAEAMDHATGEFIAIFDADFVPPTHFLQETIHFFTDPKIGMVQTRWDHLNRDDSMLTRAQAIFLDAHFLIEHAARSLSNRWINFNGTAGIWRRQAITDAGGWQSDTLTEDMDLSYRSQMAGWKFLFVPHVICPAELPPEMNAFKAQQHRWTKGGIQTGKKLLGPLLRSNAPLYVKIEACFHLTSMMVYLYITLMVLLFFPAFYVNMQPFENGTLVAALWGLSLFAMGTASAGTFYMASQKVQNRSLFWTLLQLPILMSVGVGIAINNARGVIEALVGHESPFVRTPKYNTTETIPQNQPQKRSTIPTPSIKLWMSLLEIAMGCYTLWCTAMALQGHNGFISAPFLFLFSAGYFYVGLASLIGQWRPGKPKPQVCPAV